MDEEEKPAVGGWESLGGELASAPAVTSWAANEMQVFCIFPDGALWNRYWDGEAWHPWETLGGELTGDPAACSWGADRIDLFARDMANLLERVGPVYEIMRTASASDDEMAATFEEMDGYRFQNISRYGSE